MASSPAKGERYGPTCYSGGWLAAKGIDITPYTAILDKFSDTGVWPGP